MATRFPAFRKIRENRKLQERFEYDSSLFPIDIPSHFRDARIAQLVIPSLLTNKFTEHSIVHLGQLSQMTAEQFLSWRGFGPTCLKALCHLLISVRNEAISKKHSIDYENLSKSQLAPDVLSFPLESLNLSTLLKTQFRTHFAITTVANFIDTFEAGKLSRPYIGTKTLDHVWQQIAILVENGAETYFKRVSLATRTFLELVDVIRLKLPERERIIFDHRFCPLNVDSLTLELLGNQLNLTRERVRQIEKALVKGFQSGTLREFGWLIRRKTLDIFKPPVHQLGFKELLDYSFFAGVPLVDSRMPAPLLFLDKVFYSTFIIDKGTVLLNESTRRRNFT